MEDFQVSKSIRQEINSRNDSYVFVTSDNRYFIANHSLLVCEFKFVAHAIKWAFPFLKSFNIEKQEFHNIANLSETLCSGKMIFIEIETMVDIIFYKMKNKNLLDKRADTR